MKPLVKLWLLKTKGTIRNLFKNKVSAVFTILVIVFYGVMLVGLLMLDNEIGIVGIHMAVLMFIVVLALILFSNMMQSTKALFYGDDAFYLFSGPFTRKQVMIYLTFQTISQSILIGLFAIFMLISFSGGSLPVSLLIIGFIASVVTILFFLTLTDYLYVLSIGDLKYRKYAKIIPLMIIAMVLIIIMITYIQTDNLKSLFWDFMISDLFYLVPIFGWMKLAMISFIESNYLYTILGLLLIIVAYIIVYLLVINYKGDFYEQALQDSLAVTRKVKEIKAGNADSLNDKKVKTTVKVKYHKGAYALLSKNILLMKKTNNLINMNDIITIGVYIAITLFINMGMEFFICMMIMWVITSMQNSHLSKELKNYQIYLIPDKPFNKLVAIIIPTFIKIIVIITVSFIAMGLYYHQSLLNIMLYILNVLGYSAIFIAGDVLSLRLLKSRSSAMFENFMCSLVMVLCAIPSSIIIGLIIYYGQNIIIGSVITLMINFLVSFIILYGCRNMMNGRELKSE